MPRTLSNPRTSSTALPTPRNPYFTWYSRRSFFWKGSFASATASGEGPGGGAGAGVEAVACVGAGAAGAVVVAAEMVGCVRTDALSERMEGGAAGVGDG